MLWTRDFGTAKLCFECFEFAVNDGDAPQGYERFARIFFVCQGGPTQVTINLCHLLQRCPCVRIEVRQTPPVTLVRERALHEASVPCLFTEVPFQEQIRDCGAIAMLDWGLVVVCCFDALALELVGSVRQQPVEVVYIQVQVAIAPFRGRGVIFEVVYDLCGV